MTNFNNEYYVMDSSGSSSAVRLAFYYDSSDFSYYKPIEDPELPIEVQFSKLTKLPKNPTYLDALSLKGNIAISDKVYEKLASLNLYGLQLLPIEITTPKDKKVTGYHVIHIWNVFPAIDKENYIGAEFAIRPLFPDMQKEKHQTLL